MFTPTACRPPRSRAPAALLGMLLAIMLCGCERARPEQNYFPLTAGLQWQYRITRTTMDGARELRYSIAVGQHAVDEPADVRTRVTLDGRRYVYRVNEAGIYRVAMQGRAGQGQADDDAQQMVMPAHLKITQQWQGRTATSVLESSAAPWESLFRVHVPLEMRYRVESLSASVDTPAGHFTRCLLVAGRGSTESELGNGIGRAKLEITSREWYAPDVGLVRMERNEQTSAKALSGGSLVMELDRWSQP